VVVTAEGLGLRGFRTAQRIGDLLSF